MNYCIQSPTLTPEHLTQGHELPNFGRGTLPHHKYIPGMYFSTYINFGLNWFSGFKKQANNVQKFTTNVQRMMTDKYRQQQVT